MLNLKKIIIFSKLSLLASITILLVTANPKAQGADDTGQYLIMGLGNTSCESFTAEDELGQAYYLSWLAGYMTAYNFTQKETYSILGKTKDVSQIESWLVDYCTVNPDEKFENAARNLLRNLKLFRSKSRS